MRSRFASSISARLRRAWKAGALSALVAGLLTLGACPKHKDQTSTALVVLTEQADLDADVYIDGNYVGQVGELQNATTGPIRLAPGVHRVEVRKPGRFPVQRTVRVDKRPPPETTVQAELLEDPQ